MSSLRRIDYLRPSPGLEQEFDVLVVDTEFTRLPFEKEAIWDWAGKVQPLSVAIVAMNSTQEPPLIYAVLPLNPAGLGQRVPFIDEVVLPALEAAEPTHRCRNEAELGVAISEFLGWRRRVSGKPPLLAVDWIGDAYLVSRLIRGAPQWLLLEGVAEISWALGNGFPEGDTRHNALHDAQAIRRGFLAYRSPPSE